MTWQILTDAVAHNEDTMVEAAGVTEDLPWMGDAPKVELEQKVKNIT